MAVQPCPRLFNDFFPEEINDKKNPASSSPPKHSKGTEVTRILVKIQFLQRQEAKASLRRRILELVSGKEAGAHCERCCHSSCVILRLIRLVDSVEIN